MTSTSSSRRLERPDGRVAGFTLLEILVTLAIVALAIMPMMAVRDAAFNLAFKSGHMLRAADHAEQILAEKLLDPGNVKEFRGQVESDDAFHYELTIEDYDLSTGRVIEADEIDGFSQTSNFASGSSFGGGVAIPPDAGIPEGAEDEYDPYRVRRFKLTVFYPSWDDDEEASYVIEGYVPFATEAEPGSLLGSK